MPLLLAQRGPFLLVAKPPGVLVIPGRDGHREQLLPDLVAQELKLPEPPRVCHRLDRDTSGVMLLCVGVEAQRSASAAFEHHRVRKSYLALCAGSLTEACWAQAPLEPDPKAPRGQRARQRAGDENPGTAKPARTLLVPLAHQGGHTLVAARPSTGRTHQVRAHLAHLAAPLVGDVMYGGPPGTRVLLHCCALGLFAGGQELEGKSEPWPDLSAALTSLGFEVPGAEEVDRALTHAARGALRSMS